MAEEFELPDIRTPEPESADDLKVEIVDDTPPEDRNRQPLPKDIVEELEKDDLDEYSDKVKKRLSQMKKVWHDERREKERAAREREEALQFSQKIYQENQALKQRLGAGEKVFISEVTKAATTELAVAKEKLKQAIELGDAERIADAQEGLNNAQWKLREYQQFRPSLQDNNNAVQPQTQAPSAPQQVVPDRKAEAWRERNTWFGEDEEMTALALGLHEKLVRSGVDPRSDDYYNRVDTTMKKRFPDYFGDQRTMEEDEKPAPRKAATVVAPATRSTAPRKVSLTPSQVAIAKRLGLTNEAYARELMKLENSNG
jgi:hypothetical protein